VTALVTFCPEMREVMVVVLPGSVRTMTITWTEEEDDDDDDEELEDEEEEEPSWPLEFEEPELEPEEPEEEDEPPFVLDDEEPLEDDEEDEDDDPEFEPDEVLPPGTAVAAGELSDWPAGGVDTLDLAGGAGGGGALLGGEGFAGGGGFEIVLNVGAGASPPALGGPAVTVAVHWLTVSLTVTV